MQILSDTIMINPEPEDYLASAALLDRYPDQRITLADGVVAVLSRRYSLPVWTYDHHFDVKASMVWR